MTHRYRRAGVLILRAAVVLLLVMLPGTGAQALASGHMVTLGDYWQAERYQQRPGGLVPDAGDTA